MKHFAGLDVSLKEVSICIVDEDGKTVARDVAPADAAGVAGWLTNRLLRPDRIVHESGQLSIWLQRGMIDLGLPAICIDARKAHKSLSARLNKSDSADAEGLAQLARTGWFTPVHIRSEEADRLRALVRWVEDGKFITSSGVSAGMDMALGAIAVMLGMETAENVGVWSEYSWNKDRSCDPFAKIHHLV